LPKLKDPITRQIYNIILVIVDKLIKWGYFIAYIEEISAEDIARIYIKEVFIRYRALSKIISDRDLKFILAF
jgi:hypothetical protein